ncbi:hypothetical protein KCU67_g1814, partial [Aureobasidium melanogenum]
MRNILSSIYLCSFVAALPQSFVPREEADILPDPWASDPTSPPTNISFPSGIPSNPYPSGIPDLPDPCDGNNPNDDCFNTLASGSGGYLYFDKDSGCSDSQKSMIETAVWDATTLANYASTFPGPNIHAQQSGRFWMGAEYQEQAARISGMFKRVAEFKTSKTSSKAYITMSCKDPKNWCGNRISDGSIGGYAWTYKGWLAWYHYIAFCPPFFTLDNLSEKFRSIEQELASGNTKYARQMNWLKTTGQYFLHEIMHTRIATGDTGIDIEDQHLFLDQSAHSKLCYGPNLVARLADNEKDGGSERASRNADSYAILANSMWWWDTTGYFPGLAVPKSYLPDQPPDDHASVTDVSADDDDDDSPVSLWIDLGNTTTPQDADFDSLFNAELQSFQATDDDDTADTDEEVSSAPVPAPTTSEAAAPAEATPSPPPPPPPPPPAADICGDWYKFLFDHFEIYGRNFDAEKFGTDGSGLKHQIKGCGDLTDWTFKTLTDDPQGYQWYAEGDLPIGTKACVGRAVVSAGGASPMAARVLVNVF